MMIKFEICSILVCINLHADDAVTNKTIQVVRDQTGMPLPGTKYKCSKVQKIDTDFDGSM
jgi:hypothetical protein